MNQIMKFEDTPIDIQIINGVPMFELYSVGMALGYVKTNGKSAGVHCVHPNNKSLFPFKSRIDKVAENAEIKPVLHNAKLYITEPQIYDFMLEARTVKCRAFRKWITNEVLPTLNHTGSYTYRQLSFEDEPKYEYFDKTYKGEPVLTVEDISHIIGVKKSSISYHIGNRFLQKGCDYYTLRKGTLLAFKKENPKISDKITCLNIVVKSGFVKLCEILEIKCDIPKCYCIEEKKKPSNDIVEKILKDLGITCYQLTERASDILLDKNITATGNSVLLHCPADKGGDRIFYDNSSGTYEKLAIIMQNIGYLLLGGFRDSIDSRPVLRDEIHDEAKIFSAVFLALKMFADYGGFDTSK
ncbi:MAG: hypothetical protein NC177_14395 [Ruminococcus flavefaciens]|nr:hypothetical protein [Ruminococcus flavefaciens]